MSLFKRGNTWWAYLYRDGIRYQQSTGTANRKRAEKIEDKLKQELHARQFQVVESDPNLRFDELAARFLASGSARPHHRYHLGFLLPFFGDFPVLRITKALAEDFRRARQQHNPAIKDATVNRDLSVLRHLLYWAVDEQIIPANPLARLKMARERRTHRQVLSIAEEERLLGAAKDHLRAMILVALDTGMRRGEITGQRWEDIDFAQKVLFVTRSKTPEGESREIPLTTRLYEYFVENRKTDGLVIDFRGRPVRIVKRSWKTALRNGNIRHVRFHDLRHSFATRLLEAGVVREIRMTLMGHSQGSLPSRAHSYYIHVELPAKRDAIRKLERWVTDQRNQLKEANDANEVRPESNPGQSAGTQTVEEEESRRGGPGARRQAEDRDHRDGGKLEEKAPGTAKVRRGAKGPGVRLGEGIQ